MVWGGGDYFWLQSGRLFLKMYNTVFTLCSAKSRASWQYTDITPSLKNSLYKKEFRNEKNPILKLDLPEFRIKVISRKRQY